MNKQPIYTRTDYLETYDDAYSFPSYSTDRRYGSDTKYLPAEWVLQELRELQETVEESLRVDSTELLSQIEANLRNAIEEFEKDNVYDWGRSGE
jgi:hypothetical protein